MFWEDTDFCQTILIFHFSLSHGIFDFYKNRGDILGLIEVPVHGTDNFDLLNRWCKMSLRKTWMYRQNFTNKNEGLCMIHFERCKHTVSFTE